MSAPKVTPAMVRHVLNINAGGLEKVTVVHHGSARMRLHYPDRAVTIMNPFGLQVLELLLAPDRDTRPALESITMNGHTATPAWATTKGK
jgi:hypothetical protein